MSFSMGKKQGRVWVTVVISTLLITSCGVSDSRALAKCSQLAGTWGIQPDKRNELLHALGVSEGEENTMLLKMKQHGVVNKEKRGEACLHVITEFEHESAANTSTANRHQPSANLSVSHQSDRVQGAGT